jgi:hypothetical protein
MAERKGSGQEAGSSEFMQGPGASAGIVTRVARWISTPGAGVFLLGATLAFAVLGASDQIGRAVRTFKQDNVIRVKGVAELDIASDRAVWWGTVRAGAATLPEAYAELEKSVAALRSFVVSRGIPADLVTLAAVDIAKVYRRDEKGNATNDIESYRLSQQLGFGSPNVQVVREIANGATALIKDGFEIESGAPTYKVSSIEKTKLELLEQATANAYERAQTLARGSSSSVGRLVSAAQGVYQIVARGSTSSSDYGEYDTSSIEKTARVVVTLEYEVK